MVTRTLGDCKPDGVRMVASPSMAVAPVSATPASAPAPGLRALADQCVQCGLCLPHCPTYQLDRSEAESPRGRIALWRGLAEGSLAPSPTTHAHLDHCLACRACEPVCPAGVRYGEILLQGRKLQRRRRQPAWRQRALEWLTARPALLDRLLGLYRGVARVLPAALRPLPPPPRRAGRLASRQVAAAPGPDDRPTLALFIGCVGRRYDAPAQAALQTLCIAAGIRLVDVAGQTCCGALHAHAGDGVAAGALAEANRHAFTGQPRTCTTASGCQQTLSDALAGTSVVEDVYVQLETRGEQLAFRPTRARVGLHLPCTQQRIDASSAALRRLLARVPGLEVVEMPRACCGAAGTQMITEPARARALRQPLLDAAHAGQVGILLSANVGCRLHLAQAGPLDVRHPLEFLAEHLA